MKKLLLLQAVLIALALHAPLAQCQVLTIQTEASRQGLTRADIESLPHIKVTTHSADTAAVYEGVALKVLLEDVGVHFGEALRGKQMASCLLVEAADRYRVVIALPEIDPAFNGKQIVLAYLRDGKPLDAKEGPYRIVIPDEKRMARWVRQVTALKIVDVQ